MSGKILEDEVQEMDDRIILEQGTTLLFSGNGMSDRLLVGKGSNAIVYMGSYPDEQLRNLRHRILIKELFHLNRMDRSIAMLRGISVVQGTPRRRWRCTG